ncbi:MAG: cation:dicarboxylase symporter family transporter [Bryobacterales bacterium]|nr:cation:dicarboxylase symporter family transporter [Bryobacterales bacterium]
MMHASFGMLLGLALGMAAGALLPASLSLAAEPLGLLWFNGVRMTVIPIVMAQLILGLNTGLDARALGSLGLRAFAWFTGLLLMAAGFSAVAMPQVLRWFPAPSAPMDAKAPGPVPGFGDWVANLLPSNILAAASSGQLLALILFALLFGAALRHVEAGKRATLLQALAAVNDAMLVIVHWMLRLGPYGVGVLAMVLVARLGAAVTGIFGYYILTICAIVLIVSAALYVVVLLRGRVGFFQWVKAIVPVQALAFGSRSSLAALPAEVAAAESLGQGPAITGFVLPLAASVFRYTATVAQVAGAFFVAYLYSIPLTATQSVLMVVTSVLLTYSAPGIPSSALLVALPLYQQLGLPPEGLGLLVAADAIPDMFKTMANVTAHMTVAAVVAEPRDTLGQ